MIAEVREMFDRQKEALAFANTMYALHLKAHPDEKKGSAGLQGDTSLQRGERNKRNAARARGRCRRRRGGGSCLTAPSC